MPLSAEQRARITLSDPWDFGWLAEMVEAWGFRMMQERGHFADRHEVATRWFEHEYGPVSEMLAEGGLTERGETETDAYMRLAGQRYMILRTHEWSDEVIEQLRAAAARLAPLPRSHRPSPAVRQSPLSASNSWMWVASTHSSESCPPAPRFRSEPGHDLAPRRRAGNLAGAGVLGQLAQLVGLQLCVRGRP